MLPKLNNEISDALLHGTGPLEVQDERGERSYVIVPLDEYRQLVDHEFRKWLQIGIDQADQGDEAEWNSDDILAEARQRFLAKPA